MNNKEKYLKLLDDNREDIENALRSALKQSYESYKLGSGWCYCVYFDSDDVVSLSSVMSQNTFFNNDCMEIKRFNCSNPVDSGDDVLEDAGTLDNYPDNWNEMDYYDKKDYIVKNTDYLDDLIDFLVTDYDPDTDIDYFIEYLNKLDY